MLTFGLVTIHNLTPAHGYGTVASVTYRADTPSLDVSVVSLRFGDFRICDNWLLNHLFVSRPLLSDLHTNLVSRRIVNNKNERKMLFYLLFIFININ